MRSLNNELTTPTMPTRKHDVKKITNLLGFFEILNTT